MLIKAGIEFEMADYVTAEETITAAFNLPSVKRRNVDGNTFSNV